MQICKNINQIQTKKLMTPRPQPQLQNVLLQLARVKQLNCALLKDKEQSNKAIDLLNEELAFRRESQSTMLLALNTLSTTNKQLKQQLESSKNRISFTKHLQSKQQTKQNEDWTDVKAVRRRVESVGTKQSKQFKQSKENHPITPKSRVKIQFESILDLHPCNKRKVFM